MPPAAPASPAHSKSVCIIGGGACGLIAAKQFASHGHTPLILERTSHLAGTWHYTPHPSPQSAMYDQLITNLPHDVMQASDLPFPAGTVEYPHRSVVEQYILEYERVNGLRRYVRFDSTVTRVEVREAETEGGERYYEVYYSRPASLPPLSDASVVESAESKDSGEAVQYVQRFDAVCVCNGHFSVPYYPPIPGLTPPATTPSLDSLHSSPSTARPLIMHSFHYRSPRSFAGLRVLMVGSGHSGTDIAGELCDSADRVYLSSRRSVEADNIYNWVVQRLRKAGKHVCVDSERFERVGALLSVNTDGSVTVSDTDSEGQQRQLSVDVVLLATGYHYSFPFLDSSSTISISTADLHVSPLYGSLFHPDHGGRLSFPALQWSLVPFPYCEVQCEWIARVLSGNCTLPDDDGMRQAAAAEERDKELRGVRGRFHMQCDSMVKYVWWVVEQMQLRGSDEQYAYVFTIDEDRRVRRKHKYSESSAASLPQPQPDSAP